MDTIRNVIKDLFDCEPIPPTYRFNYIYKKQTKIISITNLKKCRTSMKLF